jgi:RHS repeat-associated protein
VPVLQIEGATKFYLHPDPLGTPRSASDSAKDIVWTWGGEAFGSNLPDEDPDSDATDTTVNLRFPGQYFDAETGHHYNYFRDYEPLMGRYVQSDPIGLSGGLNAYGYVNARPTLEFDLNGEKARIRCVGVVLGAKHCYVEVMPDDGGSRRSWALHGDTRGPMSDTGWVLGNDAFDRGGTEGEWNDSCGVDQCVEEAVRSYANPTIYRFLWGPNSNTFARYIAAKCGLENARGWAPGWDADVANQKPDHPYHPPGRQP